jgi:hypothetical protein
MRVRKKEIHLKDPKVDESWPTNAASAINMLPRLV